MEDQEKFTCPRNAFGDQFGKAHWDTVGTYRVCSYCGGMHPEDAITAIKTYGPRIIEETTKALKKYIRVPGLKEEVKKVYIGHFTEEQIVRYNQAIKDWVSK